MPVSDVTVTDRQGGGPEPSGWQAPSRPPRRRSRLLVALVVTPLIGLGAGAVVLTRPGSPAGRVTTSTVASAPMAAQAGSNADLSSPVLTDFVSLPGGTAQEAPDAAGSFAEANLSSTSRQVTAKDVTTTLARRTAALRTKNEKAFLATFDPAKSSLVATQRTLFRNLVQLPLVGPVYRASSIGGSATTKRSYVSLLHQFRGADVEAAELSKVETWIRRNGVVVTTAVSPIAGHSATRYAPLDQVPLVVRNGALVTVVATDEGDLDTVGEPAEKAAAAVRAVWGTRPGPTRFIVFAGHDGRSLATWFGAKDSPGAAIAVAMPQVAMNHQTKFAGSRVVVDLSQTTEDVLYPVLRHEFTHAIDIRAQAVPRGNAVQSFPTWVEEGLAGWVEELHLPLEETNRVRELRILRKYWNHALPPAARSAFYASDERGNYNYAVAALVYRYIQARYGTAKAISFYTYQAGGNSTAAWKQLGTTQAAFTKDWGAWVDGILAEG